MKILKIDKSEAIQIVQNLINDLNQLPEGDEDLDYFIDRIEMISENIFEEPNKYLKKIKEINTISAKEISALNNPVYDSYYNPIEKIREIRSKISNILKTMLEEIQKFGTYPGTSDTQKF